VPVKNDMPIENKLVSVGEDDLTVGSLSEAAASMGICFYLKIWKWIKSNQRVQRKKLRKQRK
jgi:molybdenum-dependent DNA-binding transcriptional regulator ModE